MTDYKLVPVEPTPNMLQAACDEEQRPLPMWSRMKAIYTAMLAAAPAVQGDPVGWQFYMDGEWWNGDDRIKDHRKITEELRFRVRDVYAAPRPAPDVAGLVEALEDIGASWHGVQTELEKYMRNVARRALAANRKQQEGEV